MIEVPEKCLNCEHTIINFENVHIGWCKYEYRTVVRCDCSPVKYIVGCRSAEVYCVRKKEK